jgi:hypothetical protein
MFTEGFDWVREHWQTLGVGSAYLLRGWMHRRRLRWLEKLLELQRQQHTSSHNETIEIMSTAYSTEEPLTLDALLSKAERDFTLRSSESGSERRSIPPDENTPASGRTTPFRRGG